jgi:hypothetical protein
MRRRLSRGSLKFPPHDENSPSFHFWTLVKKNNDVAGAMRNAGYFCPETLRCKAGLVAPFVEGADPGRPALDGYKYNHALDCTDGSKYGGWVRLEDDARKRLVDEFRDDSRLDKTIAARKAKKVSVKDAASAATQACQQQTLAPDNVIGGPDNQLPISIDEYFYYNLVANRLPFSLELGFLITAKLENEEADEWSGQVGHLPEQTFFWRRKHKDTCTVQFTAKEVPTWEWDLKDLPGVTIFPNGKVEFPTTHLWVDLDSYELVWFYHKRAVAKKVIYIPFFLKGPVDWAIKWGVAKSIKGESAGDDELNA